MYKVFFNDRILFLTDIYPENNRDTREICHKYNNINDLREIILQFSGSGDVPQLSVYHHDLQELFGNFSSCFQIVEAAGGLVKNQNSEILFIYRREKWDLPKGKIDKGESTEMAAAREVSEECGISGQKLIRHLTETYHVYTEHNIQILKKSSWFEFIYKGNEILKPQINEDITKAMWVGEKNMSLVLENTYSSIKEVLTVSGISVKL